MAEKNESAKRQLKDVMVDTSKIDGGPGSTLNTSVKGSENIPIPKPTPVATSTGTTGGYDVEKSTGTKKEGTVATKEEEE